MGPIKNGKAKKSWSQINKTRKEEKKKWREHNLLMKIEKEQNKQEKDCRDVPVTCVTSSTTKNEVSTKDFVSTVSVAVPGSILENAQSAELRTYLAGQIARAACIFQVDEIVVFDDFGDEANAKKSSLSDNGNVISARHSCIQLGRILQYLECPQYLRKHFFPIHNDLKYCGILNPLNAPHHMKPDDKFTYREGIVSNKPVKGEQGSYVNVGLLKEVLVNKSLTPGLRCTVKMTPHDHSKKLIGIVVSPCEPRKETGIYWGYSVRIANSLSKVFSQCPYKDGYDVTIGTSDKGTSVDQFECPKYKHLLIMFGGLKGLEAALENDSVLNVDDPKLLFDYYLNTLPNQGSNTIRTEEAILVSLSAIRHKLNPQGRCIEFLNTFVSTSTESKEIKVDNTTQIEDEMSRFD